MMLFCPYLVIGVSLAILTMKRFCFAKLRIIMWESLHVQASLGGNMLVWLQGVTKDVAPW
jgi:hypothetical protein